MSIFLRSSPARRGILAASSALGLVALALSLVMMAFTASASSAAVAVDLGTAKSFGVLAGSAVTNTGNSVISGDLGVSPDNSVSGFPPGQVLGTIHAGDEVAANAQSDLTTAYNALAAQPPSESISADLGGRTLTAGVYNSASSLGLTGELTLDAKGDAGAVFIFQAGSTLTTAPGSSVRLINNAQACNVFWQVGSSATLDTNSTFRGNLLALTSISALTGATIAGRLLARNGAVTLDNNTVTPSTCITPTTDVPVSDGPVSDGPVSDGPVSDGPDGSDGTGGSDGSGSDGPRAGGSGSDGTGGSGGSDGSGSNGTDGSARDVPFGDGSGSDALETSDQSQISDVPQGAPDTGDGTSGRASIAWLLAGGVLVLGLTASVLVWGRRPSPVS